MLLKKATMFGYRSFRKRTELPISDRTTILIGPNDHGKTNALLAINCLNPEIQFPGQDVNDKFSAPETAYISYLFELQHREIQQLLSAVTQTLMNVEGISDDVTSREPLPVTEQAIERIQGLTDVQIWLERLREKRVLEIIKPPDLPLYVKLDDAPERLKGIASEQVLKMLPNVVFLTQDALRQSPDVVDLPKLMSNEVMQGVFRLAEIWEQRERLLSINNRQNTEDLRIASAVLTRKIRENWTQGQDLDFYLEYLNNEIRLSVKDKAKTITAVGERSQGFTAYFNMRMILVARTDAASPNGFIFMFDEPGLNLHPKGQVDLQNVFEGISKTNQIIYSTHSVFLINKNYPDRNHLIFKDSDGSNIDNKPFVGGWAKVKEHLGLYLSSNFLFSDKVLLAEGATDEMYIPLILQGLIELNKFSGDLNAFAIHSGLTTQEMISYANIYLKEGRNVAVVVDGDAGGLEKKKAIEAWLTKTNRTFPVLSLNRLKPTPCSIEDFLELHTFNEAVVSACKEALDLNVIQAKDAGWESALRDRLNKRDAKHSLGKHIEEAQKDIFDDSISDVWVARKYGELHRSEVPVKNANFGTYWEDKLLSELAVMVWSALELPLRGDTTGIPLTTT
jgi:predicted ATP-dependent endonuclease of OLD family